MSKYGPYVLGFYILMAAQFIMKALFAANKLGEPRALIPVTGWTIFAPMIIGVILELLTAILTAFIGGPVE